MSSRNFFWAKTSVALLLSLETAENIAKKAIKANVIDMTITWVSHYKNTHVITRQLRDKYAPGQPITNFVIDTVSIVTLPFS